MVDLDDINNMIKKCDITIVIPVISPQAIIEGCLKSISNQTVQPELVVLVDNRSSAVIDKRLSLPYVKTIYPGENLGFARAVNRGIFEATTSLIMVLNDDSELEDDCLEQVMVSANANSKYGSYALMVRSMSDRSKIDSVGLVFSDRGYGNRSGNYALAQAEDPAEVFSACGAAAIYRRSALSSVGVFNDIFFFLFEDLELGFRLQLRGLKCLFLPKAIVYHHGSFSSKNQPHLRVREGVKNSLITLLTCMPKKMILQNLKTILRFYLTVYCLIVRDGFSLELMRGLLAVAVKLPYCVKRRHLIQYNSSYDYRDIDELLYRGSITVNLPSGAVEI